MRQSQILIAFSKLTTYQKDKLSRTMTDMILLNNLFKETKPTCCPKCHQESTFIKKGILNKKQRYQCKSCGKKFTYDSGRITMHSHYGEDVWLKIVEDTLNCIPIIQTAADTNLTTVTVFNYRHKLLRFMEDLIN